MYALVVAVDAVRYEPGYTCRRCLEAVKAVECLLLTGGDGVLIVRRQVSFRKVEAATGYLERLTDEQTEVAVSEPFLVFF